MLVAVEVVLVGLVIGLLLAKVLVVEVPLTAAATVVEVLLVELSLDLYELAMMRMSLGEGPPVTVTICSLPLLICVAVLDSEGKVSGCFFTTYINYMTCYYTGRTKNKTSV